MSNSAEFELGYAQCAEILREHGKTFYVMSKLFGRERGRALAAVYGFCRTSDDIVDESELDVPATKNNLNNLLNEFKKAVRADSREPKFMVLGETVRKYGIEAYPFEDLVAGVAMDLEKNRYENFAELDLYCYRVAGTVGLMLIPISGFTGGQSTVELAKTLGKAFQLTNILRDIGTDLKMGRIYLPREELNRFGLNETDIINHVRDERFKRFMEFQIERAFALYAEGLALIPRVATWGGRLSFQFAADAYSEIMNKIRKNDYDVYSKRAHLSSLEKIMMVPRSLIRVVWAVTKNNVMNWLKGKKYVQS